MPPKRPRYFLSGPFPFSSFFFLTPFAPIRPRVKGDALSLPVSSVTTPGQQKRLYIDPRMLPLLEGRRVALVDDVISSGQSIVAGLSLLKQCDVRPVAIAAAMLQTSRYVEALAAFDADIVENIHACFATPLLVRGSDSLWRSA